MSVVPVKKDKLSFNNQTNGFISVEVKLRIRRPISFPRGVGDRICFDGQETFFVKRIKSCVHLFHTEIVVEKS